MVKVLVTSVSPFDSGSSLVVAESLRAPNSVLPTLAAAACCPLALPGCAITLPAGGLSTGLAVPKYPAVGEGRDPWEGGRHPLQKNCAPLPLRCCPSRHPGWVSVALE